MGIAEVIEAVRTVIPAYSGLQYVVTDPKLQWPWTSKACTNVIVDLVRSIPDLLDALAAAEARAVQAEQEVATVWNQFRFQDAAKAQAQSERDALTAQLAARDELVASADALADWVGWWLSARREHEAASFSEMRARVDAYRASRALLSRQPANAAQEG